MKARDDVRVETEQAARYAGYGLLTLGFVLALMAGAILPLLDKHADAPWYFSIICIALGIPLAYPRSSVGHAIVGRFDGILDRFLGGADKDG